MLDDTNISNIISEIETPSFGFNKKLIIVKNVNLLKKESKAKSKKKDLNNISVKLAEYIESNIDSIKESVVLVIIEETVEKCFLLEVLEGLKNSVVICDFQKLKLDELIIRLKNICNKYNVEVDKQTLQYLIELSGSSMQNLINEIRKLIEYVGENGKIKIEDVNLLAIPEVDNIIFNLTDSLGVKNIKKALETLHDLLYLKEPLQMIIVNLYRHFKKLYFVKIAERENINVAEALELKPNQMFLVSKYKKQATYFKEEELRNTLRKFLELDEKSKSGNIDLQVGVETLLCSID